MDRRANEMTHADIWDDSALVDSWNEALAEYKKYHSIHATGGKLEDLVAEHDETETEPRHEEKLAAPSAVTDEVGVEGAKATAGVPETHNDEKPVHDGGTHVESDQTTGPGGAANLMSPPQALLSSVQDEGLKRLLMSWYYAGYYTGLYEGQQKQQQDATR